MSLRFCDGFDSYAAGADLLKKYQANTNWSWNATAGRQGAGALVLTASTGSLELPNGTTTEVSGGAVAVGFYFKATAPPAAQSQFIQIVFPGPSTNSCIGINTSGFLNYLNTGGGVLATGVTNVCDGNWHWIEGYWPMQNINASSTWYVDGGSQWSGSSYSPSTGVSMDHLKIACTSAMTIAIDDFIVYDNLGAAPTLGAFPMGPRLITTTRPTTDGPCTFGTVTGGTGTHASAVNEVNPDGNTSFVQDGTSGNQDLYNYGALGYTPTVINAVMLNNYLINPNAGSINFQSACKSGAAAVSLGTSTATPLTFQTIQTPYPTDPNTSAAWTAANLNAAQFGIKVP